MPEPAIRSILVGVEVDELEGSDPTLATAVALADFLDAELHLAHAVESGPMEPPLLPDLSRQMERAAEALDLYLEGALPESFEPASRHLELGRAHRVLAERAAELEVDLLVLGPHRGVRGPAGGLGTTADRLLRTVRVPCWIARGSLDLPLGRLAVATDFSGPSRPALDLALTLSRDLGRASVSPGAAPTELETLYVEWPAALKDDPEKEERDLLPRLREEMTAAEERTGLEGAAVVHPRVLAATNPAWGILKHVAAAGSDLTVLGTHGRGAVARALLGSVAAVVAREAPGPVVLVPPKSEGDA
jgi:nucleotide-binding universal stress UspA family protein